LDCFEERLNSKKLNWPEELEKQKFVKAKAQAVKDNLNYL